MNNLDLWNKIKQPPLSALKEIKAGRLAGKTDINPQRRVQSLTEQFGQCGIGWKYTIDKLWTEQGCDNQLMCFALVSLYTFRSAGDGWSDPVPGIGGSMLVTKEKKYRCACTDGPVFDAARVVWPGDDESPARRAAGART